MDIAARLLTGMDENQKLNQLIDVRTLLHHAAFTTLPVTLEDNESKRKVAYFISIPSCDFLLIPQEETLVVAVFDQQIYVAQGKSFPVLCTAVLASNKIFK